MTYRFFRSSWGERWMVRSSKFRRGSCSGGKPMFTFTSFNELVYKGRFWGQCRWQWASGAPRPRWEPGGPDHWLLALSLSHAEVSIWHVLRALITGAGLTNSCRLFNRKSFVKWSSENSARECQWLLIKLNITRFRSHNLSLAFYQKFFRKALDLFLMASIFSNKTYEVSQLSRRECVLINFPKQFWSSSELILIVAGKRGCQTLEISLTQPPAGGNDDTGCHLLGGGVYMPSAALLSPLPPPSPLLRPSTASPPYAIRHSPCALHTAVEFCSQRTRYFH